MESEVPSMSRAGSRDSKSEVRGCLLDCVMGICLGLWTLCLGFSSAALASGIIKGSLEKEISGIESTYQAIGGLSANFTQKTYIAVMNKTIANAGEIQWKKPGKFLINYTGERPQKYISNGKKIWIYVPGDTQVEVYKVSPKTVSKEVLEFMRGFVNIRANYKITGWKKQGTVVELTLVPTFGDAPYSQLKCRFRADHLLDEVTIYNVTGNISTYKFSDIRVNSGVSDDIFEFKPPKGVKEVSVD